MIDSNELKTNKIYDKLAKTYGLEIDKTFTQCLKYDLLLRYVVESDICLDIGGANGLHIIPLAKNVREIHSIDISSKMLEECRKNLIRNSITNVHLYKRSATNLGFSDATFDVVFSYSTLLLVTKPERAYREIVRVLKPGGIAILDITGTFNLSRVYWTKYYQKHNHFGVNHYSLLKIQALFKSLDLEILETHATGFLDQWKYIPGLRKLSFLDGVFHKVSNQPDLDYKISQKVPSLANRWYFVLKKIKN